MHHRKSSRRRRGEEGRSSKGKVEEEYPWEVAMEIGRGVEGRSSEGKVEEEYPQKEVAIEMMDPIMERGQQFVQMQEMSSFFTKINPSQIAHLFERDDIWHQISIVCDNLSRFRAEVVKSGFVAAGCQSSTKMPEDDYMDAYDYCMQILQEQVAMEKELSAHEEISNNLQLIPFQEPEEYMYEYYRLHPHQDGEETELTKSAKEEIAVEEKIYAAYRSGRMASSAGCTFEAKTTLSPMYFTHCTPGVCIEDDLTATTGSSLQIISLKIAKIDGDLKWPLYVYGLVAARDEVDFNRNILFNRTRNNAQEVTENDPFLRLIGPARSILPELEFEVELRVKGRTKSRDKALINTRYPYIHYGTGLFTIDFSNCRCKIELNLEQLGNSVQATIMGVQIVKGGPCTFKYGGRVACSSPPHEVLVMDSQGFVLEVTDLPSTQVVLIDSRYCDGGEMPMGSDGYLDLTRRAVSAELRESHVYYPEKFEETFKVVIQAYSESGDVAAQGHAMLTPKLCNISQAVCDLGDSKVEITIAWSVHVARNIFV